MAPDSDGDDDNEILEEAKESYSNTKEQHQELKNALVEEHGSPEVSATVDLGLDEPVEVSGRQGGALIEMVGRVAKLMNDPRLNDENGRVQEDRLIDEISSLTDGVDGVNQALEELVEGDEWTAEFFASLYRSDIVTYVTVAKRVQEAIGEAQGDVGQSFRQ